MAAKMLSTDYARVKWSGSNKVNAKHTPGSSETIHSRFQHHHLEVGSWGYAMKVMGQMDLYSRKWTALQEYLSRGP